MFYILHIHILFLRGESEINGVGRKVVKIMSYDAGASAGADENLELRASPKK
jgi:hypothetical protein